jgi:uncharacterized membrane protein (DUF2068 family)
MKSRPTGITVLAVLGFISAAFYLAMTVIALIKPDAVASLLLSMSGGNGIGLTPAQSLFGILAAYFLISGLITAALSWGLWTLKNWARIVCIVLIGISIFGGAFGIAFAFMHSSVVGTVFGIARLIVAILIIIYLNSPRVRSAFQPAA